MTGKRPEKCLNVTHAGRARAPMTCDLLKGHKGWHKAGYVSWPPEEGRSR